MNKKFLKFLTGFSAMAVAGVLSVIPTNSVFASQTHFSDIWVWTEISDTEWSDEETALLSGNVTFTFPGSSSDIVEYNGMEVVKFLGYDYHLQGWIEFNTPITSGEECTAEFDFVFKDVQYTGCIPLELASDDNCYFYSPFLDINQFRGVPGSVKELARSIDTKVDEIEKAAQGINIDGSENSQKVVIYNYNGAINYRIIQALAKTQGVTLLYTFEYEGYVFTSAITSEMAAQIFIEGEGWYGPCYIAKHCPTVLVDVVK